MNGWRVLDATDFVGRIEYVRGRLRFNHADGKVEDAPIADLAVVMFGQRGSVSMGALQALGKANVGVLLNDWKSVPVCALSSWADHTRVGARHLAQASMTLPRRKNAWARIVRAKVRGQAMTLEALGRPGSDRLRALAAQVRSGDPANIEARAARMYWRRLFPAGFSRDTDADEGTNTLLNYGYGVLRGHGIRAVLAAGLSSPLGLFHRGRSNYFNLVDDLIEPFRPAIDAAVAELGEFDTLKDADVRRVLVAAAGRRFTHGGPSIPTEMEALAQRLGQYVEGDIDRLEVPEWAAPVDDAHVA